MLILRETICLILSSFIFCTGYGQSENILSLNTKSNYLEKNTFSIDTCTILTSIVTYNDSKKVDEEYSHIIQLFVKNNVLESRKEFDLSKDSLFIKCIYRRESVWNWGERKTSITGRVSVLSRSKSEIELNLNINVHDEKANKDYSYVGIRKFRKLM